MARHAPAATWRPWVAWALLLAAAAGVVALRTPAGAQDDELPADVIARGEQIYDTQCSTCHGGDAAGGTVPGDDRRAPAIDDIDVAYLDLVLRTGRMPPAADPFDNREREVTVAGEDREALVAWMAAEYDLEGDVPEVTPGDAAVGLAVFAANCAHCHGNAGAGGVAGAGAYTPEVAGLDPIAIVEAIRVGPFEMPAFSSETITAEEAAAIVGFLADVEHEPRTPLLGLVELNPVFAAAFVFLLALAMLFSLFFISGRPTWFPDAPTDEEQPGGG